MTDNKKVITRRRACALLALKNSIVQIGFQPRILQNFSRSLKQFFLTVGQNNFRYKTRSIFLTGHEKLTLNDPNFLAFDPKGIYDLQAYIHRKG